MTSQENIGNPSFFKAEESIGPVPSAALLAEYERVLPGVSERLIRIFEQEQMHRHQLEINALAEEKSTIRVGQILLSIAAICSVIAGVFLSSRGAEISGAIMGTAGVIVPLVAFLNYRWFKPQFEMRLHDGMENEGS